MAVEAGDGTARRRRAIVVTHGNEDWGMVDSREIDSAIRVTIDDLRRAEGRGTVVGYAWLTLEIGEVSFGAGPYSIFRDRDGHERVGSPSTRHDRGSTRSPSFEVREWTAIEAAILAAWRERGGVS